MKWLTLVAIVMLTSCSQLHQDADLEAARVANVLSKALNDELSDAKPQTPEERRIAAEDWLSEPDPEVTSSYGGATWEVRGTEGTTIRVDVYQYLESGSFFPPDQGEATWGVACRTYDVAEAVVTRTVECPEGTPDEP